MRGFPKRDQVVVFACGIVAHPENQGVHSATHPADHAILFPNIRTRNQVVRGKDVSRFFTHSGKMMPPIQRVNVDLTAIVLNELDAAAKELNISRQAVIKTLLRQGLDRHYLAESRARKLA